MLAIVRSVSSLSTGGASSGSVVDQLGCSSLSLCTSTLTTVGGAEGSGAASGDASVTKMQTSLLFAWGEGVRARLGGVGLRAELLLDVRRREPASNYTFRTFVVDMALWNGPSKADLQLDYSASLVWSLNSISRIVLEMTLYLIAKAFFRRSVPLDKGVVLDSSLGLCVTRLWLFLLQLVPKI